MATFHFRPRPFSSQCWLPREQSCLVSFCQKLNLNDEWLFTRMTNYPLSFCLWRRVNVGCGPAEERVLLTGLHAVADIYCENCKTTLGWKYVSMKGPGWKGPGAVGSKGPPL